VEVGGDSQSGGRTPRVRTLLQPRRPNPEGRQDQGPAVALPYESGPGGTRVTYTAGQAAFGAAKDLRDKLLAVAAELLEGPVESIHLSQGRFMLAGNSPRALSVAEVVAQALAGTGTPLHGDLSVTSTPPHVTSFCAQAAEVEVDPDTGQVTVKKIVTAHDVGTILNPLTHQGQIEGGMMQGLGYALMEELLTAEGQISTLSLGEYKVPTIKDIPELALEDGDRLFIPSRSSTVSVFGAVYNQNAFLYKDGKRIVDYLGQAGGPTRDADKDSLYLVKADGSVVSKQQSGRFFNSFDSQKVVPGDAIVVPEELIKLSWTKELKDWSQIFYQFALGVAGLKVLKSL